MITISELYTFLAARRGGYRTSMGPLKVSGAHADMPPVGYITPISRLDTRSTWLATIRKPLRAEGFGRLLTRTVMTPGHYINRVAVSGWLAEHVGSDSPIIAALHHRDTLRSLHDWVEGYLEIVENEQSCADLYVYGEQPGGGDRVALLRIQSREVHPHTFPLEIVFSLPIAQGGGPRVVVPLLCFQHGPPCKPLYRDRGGDGVYTHHMVRNNCTLTRNVIRVLKWYETMKLNGEPGTSYIEHVNNALVSQNKQRVSPHAIHVTVSPYAMYTTSIIYMAQQLLLEYYDDSVHSDFYDFEENTHELKLPPAVWR